jgi:hypothetical protein
MAYLEIVGIDGLLFAYLLLTIAHSAIIATMNKRHQKTLVAIFKKPAPTSLDWHDIEALFLAAGANLVEGRGSRVRFELNGVVATFHRPHPQKEAKPYQIRDARRFLEQAGIEP